jgi:ribosomal protein S17E
MAAHIQCPKPRQEISHSNEHSIRQNLQTAIMGRVRTKTVKKSAKVIIERYYPKLTLDFETNKRICDEIAIIASKRLRNKVRPTVADWKISSNMRIETDCRLHYTFDEAHSTRSRPWYLLQAPGRGERAKGSIRPRSFSPRLHPELREWTT